MAKLIVSLWHITDHGALILTALHISLYQTLQNKPDSWFLHAKDQIYPAELP